jgi:hypothetical protein
VIDRLATDPHLDRVFPVIGEFPLPDGSRATVRARRLAPVTGSTPAELAAALEAGFRRWLEAFVRDADGLEVRLVHDEAILNGRIRRVEVGAAAATVGELRRRGKPQLRVHDLGLVLEDVLVNPWSAAAEGRFDLLDVGRGRLATATVTIADLQAFVSAFKGFRRSTVTADGDALAITVRQAGPDVSARVRVRPASDGPLALEAEGVRVGGVPVPDALVSWVVRHFDPSARLARRARFAIEIGRVSVRDGALRISHELR